MHRTQPYEIFNISINFYTHNHKEYEMNQPNLFSFATSELSQDAFLCWLLSWADPSHANTDPELHRLGSALLKDLIIKAKGDLPLISKVLVKRQYQHLDVLCLVNDDLVLIIEDKTVTTEHGNQLQRYKEQMISQYPHAQVLGIYYKSEEQSSFRDVRKSGFEPYLRQDVLKLLTTHATENAIVKDYYGYLSSIQTNINNYKVLHVDEWKNSQRTWIGFYQWLQQAMDIGDNSYTAWKYVANPSGGFMGYFWAFKATGLSDTEIYLQLEHERLCIKISVSETNNRSEHRAHFYRLATDIAAALKLPLVKPPRFGHGEYMTICQWPGDYRIFDGAGVIDLGKTLERIRSLETILEHLVSTQACAL